MNLHCHRILNPSVFVILVTLYYFSGVHLIPPKAFVTMTGSLQHWKSSHDFFNSQFQASSVEQTVWPLVYSTVNRAA